MTHCLRLLQRPYQTLGCLPARFSCYSNVARGKIQTSSSSSCDLNSVYLKKCSGFGATTIPSHPHTRTVSHKAATFDSTTVEVKDDHLLMREEGGGSVRIPFYWLRDNCRCSSCFHHDTNQILHNIVDLNLDIKPTDVQSDHCEVTITWDDCHKTVFSNSWLREYFPGAADNAMTGEQDIYRTLWQGNYFNMPSFELVDLQNDRPTLKKFLQTLHEYGVALIGGVDTSSEAHANVAKLVAGGIQSTFYHPEVCVASPGLDIADTAYTNLAIPLHTDTSYFSPPCRGMTLQITERSGNGGRTVISDGFYALERLRFSQPEYFQLLCDTSITAHYLDDERDMRNCEPVVKMNSNTKQVERLRFNPFDRATITNLPYEDMLEFYKAYQALAKEIYDDEKAFKILLKPDQMVVYDNWRILHARESFTGHRVLKCTYLRHDDWMSQMRKIGGLRV
ncbi:trimethyllysine dioxygenase, mitochondrial-like [Apostichopus japonicus]|uniref:trimethyllysine dioxygenase, mitochondrial-like n=1 Tax=Stichopus japonicus TaxID=307972 RepID=UPI003AB61959